MILNERGGVMRLAMMGVALVGLALAGVLAVTAYENPERVERARAQVHAWIERLRTSRDGTGSPLVPPVAPGLRDLVPVPEMPSLSPLMPSPPEAPLPLAPSPGDLAGAPAPAPAPSVAPEAPRAPEGLSPPEAPLAPAVPAVASAKHVIQSGDTLYRIAEQYYDDPGQWPLIAEANGIRKPKHLKVGTTLTIPGL